MTGSVRLAATFLLVLNVILDVGVKLPACVPPVEAILLIKNPRDRDRPSSIL